uniref:Uncharacterized protein n=1 Tax=viral metagenome TaxID=1070528 RepID=A0A6C0EAE1_9ZZZZ
MSYISNGCNDCSTVDFGMQNMNPMGQLSGGGGYGMNNGYGAGGQLAIQPESTVMQMTSTANPYIYQQPSVQPETVQQVQVQVPVQQMVKQQVVNVPVQNKMVPVQQVATKNNNNNNNNQTGKTLQGTIGTYFTGPNFSIMLAFLVASAWNETIRYYINQAIKFNGGSPTYYIVYAVIATLASIFLSSMQ